MNAVAQHANIARREVVVADYLPYSSLVSETVVKLRGGDYLRTWRIAGIAFEAADPVDVLTRHNGFNQLVRSLGGQFALWTHRLRRRVSDRFTTRYDNAFCQELAERYYDSFAGYRMMANELYLTVIYRPHPSKLGSLFSRAPRRTLDDIRAAQTDAIRILDEIAYQIESSLAAFEPERLATYSHPVDGRPDSSVVTYSRQLEFLGYLVNGVWEPVPVRPSAVREYLPTSRLFFGNEQIEIRTPTATRHGALLDFKDYPQFSEPGLLNPLLYGDYEYIESQSFTILDKASAKQAMERQRNQLIASEDAAGSQIVAMDQALDDLIGGAFVMGDYHYSLAVFGETPEQVSKNLAKARTSLNDAGFQTALIDLVADAAWFAQLPGNWKYRPREAKITSRNFCGLSSFHNFATGKRDGNPWGEAVTILKTPSGQPYYVNFHVTADKADAQDEKALANTVLVGQSGGGKTALEMFLLALAMKYQLTCVFFDKDRGAEIAIRAMGGTYLALKRGEPTGFNPFQLEPSAANIQFWEQLVSRLVTDPGETLSAREEQDVSRAVREVARMDRATRRLSMVLQLLPSVGENSLYARLKKWCAGERLGWVLDNPVDRIDLTRNTLFGFDDTELLDDPEVLTPVTMVLLYLTESLIDGRRFIYVMTEFWKRLSDPVFSDFAKNKQKTIRKQNGFGIFDTQSPADLLESENARTMVEQSGTFFFLPNPRADHDDYVNGLKLTEAEFNIVRNLGDTSRMFLVKQGHRSAIARLDLSDFSDVLDILSGTTDNIELLDEIRAEVGDDPIRWRPVFHERLLARRAASRLHAVQTDGSAARALGGRS